MMTNPYIMGALAGLVAGILSLFAFSGASILKFLVYLAPLTCFMAGFGWRLNASLAAILAGTFFLFALGGPKPGFGFLLSIGLPTAILCYLAYLSREAVLSEGDGSAPQVVQQNEEANRQASAALEWYPTGHLLYWTAIMGAVLTSLVLLSFGLDFETYKTAVKELFQNNLVKQLETLSGREFSPTELSTLSEVAVSILPGMITLTWLTLTIFNLWLGARIVLAMGKLQRPWPFIPALEYPNAMPLTFVAAIILSIMGGMLQLFGIALVTALLLLYVILGFAVLHTITMGNPYRPFMLTFAYMVFVFIGQYGVLIMATLGIAEPLFKLRKKFAGGPPQAPT